MKQLFLVLLMFWSLNIAAQDTSVVYKNTTYQLTDVVVRNSFNIADFIDYVKNDSTFYKAFRNLRVLGFTSFNDIKMTDKKGNTKASLFSKTKQTRVNGCRTMQVLEEKTTGDFYDNKGNNNYTTADLYASLFFTKGTICGEDNIVNGKPINPKGKKGIEKHKEQLKMLFFNPGKKIPGIPLMGDKVDVYDKSARKVYNYKIDRQDYFGKPCFVFTISPKEDLGLFRKDDIVFDEIITYFDAVTMAIVARNYSLSYNAGAYSFDVNMEVEMTTFKNYLVPKVLRYKGDWDVVFKKKERAQFTATLFDFKDGK